MNDKARETIINSMRPFMEECGFEEKDGFYSNGKKSFSIDYDSAKKQFVLMVADINLDEPGSYAPQSAWLFDENHDEKDAELIGRDFTDTLRETLGMKVAFSSTRDISLPNKAAPGSVPGIEAFTQKFLTIYPQYKETYKNEIALHGEFLYDRFFSSYAVPMLRDFLRQDNKKALKKMFDMFEEYYSEGDRVVTSTISFSILSEAFGMDEELWSSAEKYMEGTPLLKSNARNIKSFLQTNQKYDRIKFWKKSNRKEA
ncbi:MAG TPA: hypothetical protein DEQ02_01620 [Ruminococcaceae bacterium]|nr:hypothetical protein [Oscillospiraceae bacterium]